LVYVRPIWKETAVVEESPMGLTMLSGDVAVSVTREEHHQAVLARYSVAVGSQRNMAAELGWCTIGSGKYRGQRAIEVRLDGQRVGELTYLMSQRYGPLVDQLAARQHRPGCVALIQRGAKGLEVVLRLPRNTSDAVPTPPPRRRGSFSAHRPAWIAAGVVAILFIGALAGANDEAPSSTPAGAQLGTSTTIPEPSTPPPTTEPTTTTSVAVAPPPAPPQPPAVPRTTTKKPAAPAPAPQPAEPAPKPTCDPNYSGCVPIASDVDCLGGSGNGPAYVKGPIRVIGTDIYDLDRNGDGVACE
jgi:hypothetical protein